MNVRKVLLCAVAVAAIASTSVLQAQEEKKKGGGGGRGGMSPEQQIERIEQAVGKLTEDQKTKIKGIYAKMSEKMQAISQEERREKGRELFETARKDIRAVLTPEQAKKYDEMPQGGRGGGGGGKKNN